MIGVVDYGAGNLTSVESALRHLSAFYKVSDTPCDLEDAERLIFPGVGEAASAMKVLKNRGWDRFLADFAASGRPLLGICLGSQILLEHSDEGNTPCLALIPGNAPLFKGGPGLKVPHMGWNTLDIPAAAAAHPLMRNIPEGSSFYFVHSFFPSPDPAQVQPLARCTYGETFTAAYARANVMATQFHPEKSGPVGLRLLQNYLTLNPEELR